MDEKSLQMLEFPKVREIIAGFTSLPMSYELAVNLQPSSDPELVTRLLMQSAEARRLLSLNPNFSIGGAVDIRENVALAARGKILDPQALRGIQRTLTAAGNLRAGFGKLADELPSLWSIAEQIVNLPHLEQEIGRCIDAAGEMLDSASPKLAEIRHQIRETRQQLVSRLEGIVKSPRGRRLLQESLVTEREGRYVIPVKVELQSEVKGIVHDVSNTGATVFIEPWPTVELGNKLRQLASEEQRETQRILAALSAETGANQDVISRNAALSAEFDLALAKARYAENAKASEPRISSPNPSVIKLIDSRHPLLKGRVVPLSIEIGSDFSSLIITGPNTGGKTVALKTIGLLALMAQSGMPIPASEGSCIPVFDNVFADIGDEQSIEQTLSTFSWHMGNIVRVIGTSTRRSLVLLDELGASTDPSEGAALARAILLHFLSQETLVVATTHYSELKVFAHATPGMRNASLEFDPVTLAPTYHLTVGIPGGSNALAIASQLGLSSEIISSARGMLSSVTAEIEDLLTELASEKHAARTLREEMEKEKAEAENLKNLLEREFQRMKEQEQVMLSEVRDRLAKEAAELQKQVRQASTELKKAKSKESIEQAKETLSNVRDQLGSSIWQPQSDHGGILEKADSLAVGDHVRLLDTSLLGTIISIFPKSNQVEVQAGQTKIRIDMDNVEKVSPPGENSAAQSYMMKQPPRRRKMLLELDLRGKRADEVEPEVDSYLNDASLSGLGEVCIIHGYGTGTVRQIVRDMLLSHPLVKSFRSGKWGEGGDGVTIVEL